MKWGRKKLSSSSSHRNEPSFMSHVFPISWLSKFKRMNINSEPRPGNDVMLKARRNSATPSSPVSGNGVGGRFYGADGDAFWRLSFGEDDDQLRVPLSSCQRCRSNVTKVMETEEKSRFNKMVGEMKMRELHGVVEKFPGMAGEREKGAVTRTPRKIMEKEMKLRKGNHRVAHKLLELAAESDEAKGREMESVRSIWNPEDNCKPTASDSRKPCFVSATNPRNNYLRTIKEESVAAAKNGKETDELSAEKVSLYWQKLKEMKIEEPKLKIEKQRKSLHISREPSPRRKSKQSSRIRVNSPRTPSKVEICKIKALEDMRKAKLKMNKAKERAVEKNSGLESFAMVKCSFDPQKDFRESMIEMIMEKRIKTAEELEELLACYLTLNSDEFHDLIIKVFRQVWFDLNQACVDSELQN